MIVLLVTISIFFSITEIASGNAALLVSGSTPQGGSKDNILKDASFQLDTKDKSLTRIFGNGLKLDLSSLEIASAEVLKLSPKSMEFTLGSDRWIGSNDGTGFSLRDQTNNLFISISKSKTSKFYELFLNGQASFLDIFLDRKEATSMLENLCRADRTISGLSTEEIDQCPSHVASTQLSLQQTLDYVSKLITATASHRNNNGNGGESTPGEALSLVQGGMERQLEALKLEMMSLSDKNLSAIEAQVSSQRQSILEECKSSLESFSLSFTLQLENIQKTLSTQMESRHEGQTLGSEFEDRVTALTSTVGEIGKGVIEVKGTFLQLQTQGEGLQLEFDRLNNSCSTDVLNLSVQLKTLENLTSTHSAALLNVSSTLDSEMTEGKDRLTLALEELGATVETRLTELLKSLLSENMTAISREISQVGSEQQSELVSLNETLVNLIGESEEMCLQRHEEVVGGMESLLNFTSTVEDAFKEELTATRTQLHETLTEINETVFNRFLLLDQSKDEFRSNTSAVIARGNSIFANAIGQVNSTLQKTQVDLISALNDTQHGLNQTIEGVKVVWEEKLKEETGLIRGELSELQGKVSESISDVVLQQGKLVEGVNDSLSERVNSLGSEVVVGLERVKKSAEEFSITLNESLTEVRDNLSVEIVNVRNEVLGVKARLSFDLLELNGSFVGEVEKARDLREKDREELNQEFSLIRTNLEESLKYLNDTNSENLGYLTEELKKVEGRMSSQLVDLNESLVFSQSQVNTEISDRVGQVGTMLENFQTSVYETFSGHNERFNELKESDIGLKSFFETRVLESEQKFGSLIEQQVTIIGDKIKGTHENTTSQLNDLQEEISNNLIQFEGKIDIIRSEAEKNTSKLGEKLQLELNDVIQSLATSVTLANDSIWTQIEEIKIESQTLAELQNFTLELQTQQQGTLEELTLWQKTSEQKDENQDASIAALKESCDSVITELRGKQQEDVNGLWLELGKNKESFEGKITGVEEGFNSKIELLSSSFTSDLSGLKDSVEKNKESQDKTIESLKTFLTTEDSSLQQKIINIQSDLRSDFISLQGKIDQQSTLQTNSLTDERVLREKNEQEVLRLFSLQDQNVLELKTDFKEKLNDSFEELKGEISETNTSTYGFINEIRESLTNKIDFNAKENIGKLQEVETVLSTLKSTDLKLTQDIEAYTKKSSEDIEKVKNHVENGFAKVDVGMSELQKSLVELGKALESQMERADEKLEGKMTELKGELNEFRGLITTEYDSLEKKIDDHRDKNEEQRRELIEKHHETEKKVVLLEQEQGWLRSNISSVSANHLFFYEKVDKNLVSLVETKANISTLEEKLGFLSGEYGKLEGRFNSVVENNLQNISWLVGGTQATVEEMKKMFIEEQSDSRVRHEGLESKITGVSTDLQRITDRINTEKTENAVSFEEHRQQHEGLKERLTELSLQLTSEQTNMKTDIEALKKEETNLKIELPWLQTKLSQVEESVQRVLPEVDENREKLGKIEIQQGKLETASKDWEEVRNQQRIDKEKSEKKDSELESLIRTQGQQLTRLEVLLEQQATEIKQLREENQRLVRESATREAMEQLRTQLFDVQGAVMTHAGKVLDVIAQSQGGAQASPRGSQVNGGNSVIPESGGNEGIGEGEVSKSEVDVERKSIPAVTKGASARKPKRP